MECGIYAIYNVVSDKMYVGKSTQISRRWRDHLKDLRGGYHKNGYLQASWNKHGSEAFIFGVLEEVPTGHFTLLGQRESHWVSALDTTSRGHGYNLALVGSDGIATASPETRARQRASHLGVKMSAERIANSAAAHRGLKRSNQTKAKMSAANTGQRMTIDQCEKLRDAKTGQPLSDDHKDRIRKAYRGNVITDEDRRQILARSLAGEPRPSIASSYGVSPSYVSTIRRGTLVGRNGHNMVLVNGAWVTVNPTRKTKNGTLVIDKDDAKILAGI